MSSDYPPAPLETGPLRIAVISKADHFGGGASRVASELVSLLVAAGHKADHWLSWAGNEWNERTRPLYGRHPFPIRAANFVLRKVGLPNLIPFELGAMIYGGRIWDYDLLHFHDLSSAISPHTLLWLSRYKPVVWTIHDCSPFTGGCLYPMQCTGFMRGCGNCPQLGDWPIDGMLDFTGFQQGIKRRLAASGRIHYITPSAWMARTAMASGLFAATPEVLPNGVDTTVFKYADKTALREQLALPADRLIVLLSAGSLQDERKGTRYSIESLLQVRDLKPFILLVGNSGPALREQLVGFDVREAGYIGDPTTLARHYGASDVFLFTSLADNQPLTVLETMAAGTPMVGFDTGGIPEMVVQEETGYLVPQKDAYALSACLRRVLGNPAILPRWGRNGVRRVDEFFSHDRFLESHLAFYRRILATCGGNFSAIHSE